MKRLLLAVFSLFIATAVYIPEAEAKRLGGGGSSGMQRNVTPDAPAATPQRAAPNQAGAAPQQQPRRSWMGPLAGLAAGLGLAALASHLGMGEELMSMLLIALLVGAGFMVFRMLTRRGQAPQAQPMQYAGAPTGGAMPPAQPQFGTMAGTAAPAARSLPAGFDAEGFARQAKLNFIRLQAANDRGDLDDLREFTTPEMFAEIKLQLSERGGAAQQTDVLELDAQVLEVVEESNRYIVSVRFTGLIREDDHTPPTRFDEVWHLVKPVSGETGWRVAGIQQIA